MKLTLVLSSIARIDSTHCQVTFSDEEDRLRLHSFEFPEGSITFHGDREWEL